MLILFQPPDLLRHQFQFIRRNLLPKLGEGPHAGSSRIDCAVHNADKSKKMWPILS